MSRPIIQNFLANYKELPKSCHFISKPNALIVLNALSIGVFSMRDRSSTRKYWLESEIAMMLMWTKPEYFCCCAKSPLGRLVPFLSKITITNAREQIQRAVIGLKKLYAENLLGTLIKNKSHPNFLGKSFRIAKKYL